MVKGHAGDAAQVPHVHETDQPVRGERVHFGHERLIAYTPTHFRVTCIAPPLRFQAGALTNVGISPLRRPLVARRTVAGATLLLPVYRLRARPRAGANINAAVHGNATQWDIQQPAVRSMKWVG